MGDLSESDSRYRTNEVTHQIDLVRPDNLYRFAISCKCDHPPHTFLGTLTSLTGAHVKGQGTDTIKSLGNSFTHQSQTIKISWKITKHVENYCM